MNAFHFTGREYNPALGLQYNRARWYLPQVAGFATRDPIGFNGGDLSLTRYARANPLIYVDPLGRAGILSYLMQPVAYFASEHPVIAMGLLFTTVVGGALYSTYLPELTEQELRAPPPESCAGEHDQLMHATYEAGQILRYLEGSQSLEALIDVGSAKRVLSTGSVGLSNKTVIMSGYSEMTPCVKHCARQHELVHWRQLDDFRRQGLTAEQMNTSAAQNNNAYELPAYREQSKCLLDMTNRCR